MLRPALLLLSIPLLAHGGNGIYQAVRNRQMTTVTCPQLMMSPPQARWLRVIGCDFDYTHPAIIASGDRVTQLYFAVRPRNEPRNAPVSLIVATHDPDALAATQQALATGAAVDDEAFTVAMLRVVGILRAAREIDGYARAGLIEGLLTRRDLAEFYAPRTSRLIVLDLHARPSVLVPGLETGAGLLLLAAAALRRRKPVAVAEPSAAEPGAPLAAAAMAAPPRAVLDRQLPPAMLLNLDASASISEIEHAPPLGDLQDVAARMASVLGPLTDAGGGRYHVRGSDWQLDFDLGRDDSVWTATVDARGSGAALDALDRLTGETSWRVFVPRLGRFR